MSTEVDTQDEANERKDRLIWKALGVKSAREIAKETGMTPDEVLRRKNQMLDEVDVLTIQQTRQKLIVDLREIAQVTRDDYEKAGYEFKAGLMNSAIAAMKAILVEVGRQDAKESAAVERLNGLRIRELLHLLDRTVFRSLTEISETYDIDEAELQEIFQRHLRPAAEEIDAG